MCAVCTSVKNRERQANGEHEHRAHTHTHPACASMFLQMGKHTEYCWHWFFVLCVDCAVFAVLFPFSVFTVFVGCAVFILASSTAHFIDFINIATARWLIQLFLHRVQLYVGMCVCVCLSLLMSEASIETTLLSFHRCISKRWLFEKSCTI